MAKRFTDSGLNRKAWFRKLPPRLKCAWRFLCDECDNAGIWSIDMDSLTFHVGDRVGLDEILDFLNQDKQRVIRFDDDKLFLPGFIEFQYGTLSAECKPHQPVISRLKKLNLWKGYAKGFQTLEEKEKEKDKEKEKEKIGGVGDFYPPRSEGSSDAKKFEARFLFDFQKLFDEYPRQQKRSSSLSLMAEFIRDRETYDQLRASIANYRAHCAREGTESGFMLTFPKFIEEWRDWLDPKNGTGLELTKPDESWMIEARAEDERRRELLGSA